MTKSPDSLSNGPQLQDSGGSPAPLKAERRHGTCVDSIEHYRSLEEPIAGGRNGSQGSCEKVSPPLWQLRLPGSLDSNPALLIHLPKIGSHALARPTYGSTGLHQNPIGMPFPFLPPTAASQIHNAILRIQNGFARGLVFTTRDFLTIGNQIRNARLGNKAFSPSSPLFRARNPLKIIFQKA
jgi:hypothetical protein